MGRRKRSGGSLKYTIKLKLKSLDRVGEDKHAAKQAEKMRCKITGEKWNPAKVDGIFSKDTRKAYREHANRFATWVREKYPAEVKKIQDIKPKHVGEWLQRSINSGNSAWTVRLQAAAMAKVLDCSSDAFGVELPRRQRADITRSRESGGKKPYMDGEIDHAKYANIIDFCRGAGLRRHELAALKPSQILEQNEKVRIVGVMGKGGKVRDITVVEQYKTHALQCKQAAASNDTVFEKIPSRLDIHSYRREFCTNRYKEIASRRERERAGRQLTKKEKYYTRDGTHRQFDRGALLEVSKEMGHNRCDVMVKHYLD